MSSISTKYTDAPELHPNLILGSFQLLFWLLLHPSAWRNYVARIDPTLSPTFCLADLGRTQWYNPAIRQLLIMGYVLLTIFSISVVGFVLWVLGISRENIIIGMTGCFVIYIMGILANVSFDGVGDSIVFNVLSSIVGGVILGLANSLSQQNGTNNIIFIGIMFSFVFGIVGNSAGSIENIIKNSSSPSSLNGTFNWTYTYTKRIYGGVIIGIIVGGISIYVTSNIIGGIQLDVVKGITVGTISSLKLGLLISILTGIASSLRVGPYIGIKYGLIAGLLFVLAINILSKTIIDYIVIMTLFTSIFMLTYSIGKQIAGTLAGAIASAFSGGVGWTTVLIIANDNISFWTVLFISLTSTTLGFIFTWILSVVIYPFILAWNDIIYHRDKQNSGDNSTLLHLHSAFWDEHHRLRLYGLDQHIILISERNMAEAQAAIEYLSTGRQRWAAQAAQIELDARRLEQCVTVQDISRIHKGLADDQLSGPASNIIHRFQQYGQDIETALNQINTYHQRLSLTNIKKELNKLLDGLTRSSEAYATRFYPIASHWRQIVTDYLDELKKEMELNKEIENPYIVSKPIGEYQEIFVGRTDISLKIEQLLLDYHHPPLLIYGQRRMGKTSLLRNLNRLLPNRIVPFFVDGQRLASVSNYASYLYNMAIEMRKSAKEQRNLILPDVNRKMFVDDPFTTFNEWLDDIEEILATQGDDYIALITLDELETLDTMLEKEKFDEEDVLNLLRHLVQHRSKFNVLLASSHTLDELRHWASQLINFQVIKIDYLTDDEAHKLINFPVKGFTLQYEPEASKEILALTRGHPHLIQLLCYEIVHLKNNQAPSQRRLAILDDVTQVIPKALVSGSMFFIEIERSQNEDGVEILRFLATQPGGTINKDILIDKLNHIDGLNKLLSRLLKRDLIEQINENYRFQIELIRRWFVS